MVASCRYDGYNRVLTSDLSLLVIYGSGFASAFATGRTYTTKASYPRATTGPSHLQHTCQDKEGNELRQHQVYLTPQDQGPWETGIHCDRVRAPFLILAMLLFPSGHVYTVRAATEYPPDDGQLMYSLHPPRTASFPVPHDVHAYWRAWTMAL